MPLRVQGKPTGSRKAVIRITDDCRNWNVAHPKLAPAARGRLAPRIPRLSSEVDAFRSIFPGPCRRFRLWPGYCGLLPGAVEDVPCGFAAPAA